MLTNRAAGHPKRSIIDAGAIAGSVFHQARWVSPSMAPRMKNNSVTSMRVLPPPTVNRVPEAQPPPSCMPIPNRKEPITTEMLSGETKPSTGCPNRLPEASAGKNNRQAPPSMTICARKPALRCSAKSIRNAPVKPNREW